MTTRDKAGKGVSDGLTPMETMSSTSLRAPSLNTKIDSNAKHKDKKHKTKQTLDHMMAEIDHVLQLVPEI